MSLSAAIATLLQGRREALSGFTEEEAAWLNSLLTFVIVNLDRMTGWQCAAADVSGCFERKGSYLRESVRSRSRCPSAESRVASEPERFGEVLLPGEAHRRWKPPNSEVKLAPRQSQAVRPGRRVDP